MKWKLFPDIKILGSYTQYAYFFLSNYEFRFLTRSAKNSHKTQLFE